MAEQIPGGPEGPNNWQVIGVSRDQWKLLAASLDLGGNVRAGLEDNLYLPNGEMAKSNGELIAKARQMAEDIGRRAATVAEAREMLGAAEARAGKGLSMADCRSQTSRSSISAAAARRLLHACCSPTSAPTCSRSRTPGWATTSAGRRPTTGRRGQRRSAPARPLPGAEPQQALDPDRPK